ncbi:von Willebrand factor D and EGF domain-containing protein-like [Planoprotostelium fungivorum]|uniref:protein-tyrosine-phosphatase n=1 Tax=Planoprotostelium fungivorum TaxID=1890364 RepID=A0A2P6NY72_9EUKA|nr:von Willebrand factor D and EGF domain-containing protein-like [Planoprotostelium fungivorum]
MPPLYHTRNLSVIFIACCIFFAVGANEEGVCDPPCIHGSCLPGGGNACGCEKGWGGPQCQLAVCDPPCINGACTSPNTCACSTGWKGSNCASVSCDLHGCVHGNCSNPDQCDCAPGWVGPACDTAICIPGCANGGTCIGPGVCACNVTAWTGPSCKEPICNGKCQHNTTCVGPMSCTGWTGNLCENDIHECLDKNKTKYCDRRTRCINTLGSFSCSSCPSGYIGSGKISEGGCVPNCEGGCLNGGICDAPNTCNCTGTGFTGPNCFQDLDECKVGGYCDPKLQCINILGSFICHGSCPGNYTGDPRIGCTPICDPPCPAGGECLKPNVCSNVSAAASLEKKWFLVLLSLTYVMTSQRSMIHYLYHRFGSKPPPEFQCTIVSNTNHLKITWPKSTISHDVLQKIFRNAKPILREGDHVIDLKEKPAELTKGTTYTVDLDAPVAVHQNPSADDSDIKEVTVGINTPANADLSIIEKPADTQPPVLSVGTVLSALAGSGKDANSSLEKERKQKGRWEERTNHIIDGLWLGDFLSNSMHVQMNEYSVGHILTVSNDFRKDKGEEFVHHLIGVPDYPSSDLFSHFAQTHEFINTARYGPDNKGPQSGVLVHCMAGVSRSATIVIAYLMKELGLSLIEAAHLTRSSRAQIWPNGGFVLQLERYERELNGEIDTHLAPNNNNNCEIQ